MQTEGKYIGYLTADGLDHDEVAYACQSCEGWAHIEAKLANHITFDAEFYSVDARSEFCLNLSSKDVNELQVATHHSIGRRKTCIGTVSASFRLKYSYFDCLHRAVDNLSPQTLQRIIPTTDDRYLFSAPNMTPVHDNFELKGLQKDVFTAIVNIQSWKAPILLFGPFGSGKTQILASAVYHELQESTKSCRILLCAHNNSTVDNFVHNYFHRLNNGSKKVNMIRLIPKQDYINIDDDLHQYYGTIWDRDVQTLQLIVTTFSTASLLMYKAKKVKFRPTHIFIDEGAQACEPESIIPLCLASKDTKIVIAGDHKQV